jgi:hypothetical protein
VSFSHVLGQLTLVHEQQSLIDPAVCDIADI